ncbi:MAG: hypothetical protein M1839_003096 [Geoglossum umbratile]|nr:MAG: hypothetical protein M1839_003096 [Geoglossum umbratile]
MALPIDPPTPQVAMRLRFARRAREQPSMKKMIVVMQTMQTDLSATKSAISGTKNTINIISVDPSPSSSPPASKKPCRDVVASRAALATQQAGSPTSGNIPSTPNLLSMDEDREIIIKLHDSDKANELRLRRSTELTEHINAAISNGSNPHVQTIRVMAAKQLKSGDISTHTARPEECEIPREFVGDCTTALGPKTEVPIATYGVIIHGIRTDSINMSHPEEAIHNLKVWNAAIIPSADIKYIG